MSSALLPVWFSKLDGHSQSISLLTVHHDQGHTCPSCQKAAFARRTPDSPPSLNPHGQPRPPPALRSWAPCAPPSAASSIPSARRCPSRWSERSPAPPGSGRSAESPAGSRNPGAAARRARSRIAGTGGTASSPAAASPASGAPAAPPTARPRLGSARGLCLLPPPGPLPCQQRGPTCTEPQSGWRAQCSSREGQQQRSSPRSSRSSIPPGRAGGGAGSGRPGDGAERAGGRGVGSHPSPERHRPNFNSGGEGGREGGRWAGGEGKGWSGKPSARRGAVPPPLPARPLPGCSAGRPPASGAPGAGAHRSARG